MFKDFKTFIMRGNVMDLAVGVIIGAAFGKIVSSLVNDLLMPIISLLSGGVNLSGLKMQIGGNELKPVYLAYGSFVQALIDFLIIATAVFVIIRTMNRLQKPSTAPTTTKICGFCRSTVPVAATKCAFCTSSIS